MRIVIRYTAKYSLWLLGSLLILTVLLAAILSWRLAAGPLQVGFLTPYLERALDASLAGRHIDIQDTVLAWNAESRDLDLLAREVTIRDADGTTLASLPIVNVTLSRQALWRGLVAVSAVEVERAQVILTRHANGAFQFGSRADSVSGQSAKRMVPEDAQDLSRLLPAIAHQLMSDPAASQPLAYLQELRIVNGALRLDDRQRGAVWSASQMDFGMRRERQGLTGHFRATLASQPSAARIDSQWSYHRSSSLFDLQVAVANLRPAMLPHVVPGMTALAGLNVPLAAQLNLSVDLHGAIKRLTFQVSGGAGQLSYPGLLPTPLPLASFAAEGRLDDNQDTLYLDHLALNLGTTETIGPSIQAKAIANGLRQSPTVRGEVTLKTFRLADLKGYWPVGVLDDAGAWLTGNMVQGTIDQAHLSLVMDLPGKRAKTTTVKQLDGTLQYHGIEVHYLRPLPPFTGVSGSARFNRQGFRIKVDRGGGPFRLADGDVDITGLDVGRDAIRIRVTVDTPVRDVLTLLDHPPLDLLSPLGIQAAATSGHAMLRTEVALPLRGEINFDNVRIKVDGTIQNAVLQDILLGHTVDRGALQLRLDNAGMQLKGAARFAGIPLTLTWDESFNRDTAWRHDVQARATRVSRADLQAFGFDLPDVIKGTFAADVQARSGWQGHPVVRAVVDLQETAISIPQLGWQKAIGAPGEAHGTFHIHDATGITTGDFEVKAATLAARGSVHFDPSRGGITRLDLHEPVLGNTHLNQLTLARQGDDIDILLGSGVVDLQPLLAFRTDSQNHHRKQGTTFQTQVQVRAPFLRRVYFGPHRYLQDVKLELTQQAGRLTLLDFSGDVPDAFAQPARSVEQDRRLPVQSPHPRGLTVTYHRAAQAARALSVQTTDLGAALRALNLHDGLIGGQTTIIGKAPGPGADGSLQGTIEVSDFILKDAPVLARILAAVSFTGLLNTLQHEGLTFSKLLGDFSLRKTVLTARDWRAAGGALGITGNGKVDMRAGDLDLRGTIIPARTLNTLPGKIPLLGELIVGGKGHGMIAVNYRARGSISNPKIAVNPASALTPGFLRGIFSLFKRNEPDAIGQVPSVTSPAPTPP